ncbi:MAG: Nudix family hydrolase [Lysobacteraceae bacterium]
MAFPPPAADGALHVVAAVLEDGRGRVLVARRPAGKAHAGLWEFPGGKVEPGESRFDALRRELREELDLDLVAGQPLIRVPVAGGAGIALRLEAWRATATPSTPIPREHDALAWVDAVDLLDPIRWPMPPADRPVVAALAAPALAWITPPLAAEAGLEAEATWLVRAESVLGAGVKRVHLRLDDAQSAQRWRLAEALAPRCAARGATLLIHGDAGLAASLGLGLHLRSAQLAAPPAAFERVRAAGRPCTAAAHDAADLARAAALGLDAALLSPVLPTPTHPGQPGLGWARFEAIRATAPALPVYALGGVGPADLMIARAHGAQGVAGIRAFG